MCKVPLTIVREEGDSRGFLAAKEGRFYTFASSGGRKSEERRGRDRTPTATVSSSSRRVTRSHSPHRASHYTWEEEQHQQQQGNNKEDPHRASLSSTSSSSKYPQDLLNLDTFPLIQQRLQNFSTEGERKRSWEEGTGKGHCKKPFAVEWSRACLPTLPSLTLSTTFDPDLDCHCTKLGTLTASVHQLYQSHDNHVPATHKHRHEDEEEGRSASPKKCKRIYESDEIDGSSTMLFSPCSPSSASESDDVVPLSTSMSEEFGLTKTMMCNSYNTRIKDDVKKNKPIAEEKNIELEMASSSKATNEVGVVNGDGDGGKRKSARKHLNSCKGSVSNGCDAELKGKGKGKEGPRFKDLGGMREVIEPLNYLELLQELGVRPMPAAWTTRV